MTFYTCYKLLVKHKISIMEWVEFKWKYYIRGTSANLLSQEKVKIIDLFYCLLLPSGNDAA